MDGLPSPSGFESISRKLYAPLVPPLLAVLSGILFVNWLGFAPVPALALAALSFLLWLLARQRQLGVAAIVAGNAVCFWLGAASASRYSEIPRPQIDSAPRERVSLSGCVDSLPRREAERLQFDFAAAPGARLRVSLYLKPDEAAPPWTYGDSLTLPLRLKPIRNTGNPGNFDAERFFGHRSIFWSASVSSGYPIEFQPGTCGHPVQALIYRLRSALLNRIQSVSAGDAYLSAMLSALLLGDNSRLEEADTRAYRHTGTYHALVISGLHVGILTGALFFLLQCLGLRAFQAYLLCALLATLYALVCDLSTPVVRAAGGYLIFLGARYFYRRGRILNILAAVAILFLLADPGQLFEASFQLSFLAVLTLATLAIPFLEWTTGTWSRALHQLDNPVFPVRDPRTACFRVEFRLLLLTLSRLLRITEAKLARLLLPSTKAALWFLDLFFTSAVILIGLCLPMILYFHRLSFASLGANLPVVAILTLTLPLGFLALLTGPTLAPVLAWLLHTSRDVVDWHLSWDPGLRIPDPPLWFLLLFPASLLATAWAAHHRCRWLVLPLTTSAALFFYLAAHPYSKHPILHPGLLELTAIDVGQGDALFIATPNGHLALLDGGGSRSSRSDPGESTVSPYLWSRRIARLDTLIASHGDLDHIGGLLAAHDNFLPREIWVGSQIRGPLWTKLRDKALRRGIRIRELSRGDCLQLGELAVTTLWPPRDEVIEKSNLSSLVLLLRHGNKHFLLTGDIEQSVELRLLEDPALGSIDYLKVAHHGSRTSSSLPFLDHTRPAIAVASAGFQNPFGHPHPLIQERLAAAHSLLFRTDTHGQITILSDGQRLTADPFLYRSRAAFGWIPFTQALE